VFEPSCISARITRKFDTIWIHREKHKHTQQTQSETREIERKKKRKQGEKETRPRSDTQGTVSTGHVCYKINGLVIVAWCSSLHNVVSIPPFYMERREKTHIVSLPSLRSQSRASHPSDSDQLISLPQPRHSASESYIQYPAR